MPAHLTPAQARALGIDVKGGKTRGPRNTARGPYATRCYDCGDIFTGPTAEDRHVDQARHWRYELVLETAAHGRPSGAI